MNKKQEYKALRIPYGQVSWYIGQLVSIVLSRPICCMAHHDDYDYWSVSTIDTKLSNSEIASLVEFVKGGSMMYSRAIPTDSNFSKSMDMELCQALLKYALNLQWTAEYPDTDALWLMGQWNQPPVFPSTDADMVFLNGKTVNIKDLPSKEDVVTKIFAAGGSFSDLVEVYERYVQPFGMELYWHYPISDEYYSGTYFALVQEGVLAIAYNYMDECDHELFSEDSVKLLSAEQLGWYIQRWEEYSAMLQAGMGALYCFQSRRENEYG